VKDFQLNKIHDKKIVFFSAETIPSSAGGGRNAFHFARYFARCGIQVSLCCLNYNKKLKKHECIDNVNIQRITYYNCTLFHKIISLPALLINYFKKIKDNDIIFIYGRYLPLYIFILLFGFIFHRKIIFRSTLLGDDDMLSIRRKAALCWPVYNFLFKKISLYWAINRQFEINWQKLFSGRTPVLCSVQGIDKLIFSPGIRNTNLNSTGDIFTILSCGIVVERKGYRYMFESLSQLNINFRFIVVGQYLNNEHHKSSRQEKSEMEQLYRLGNNLLKDKIEFIDSSENMPDLYAKADVFLHGAFAEGTPNVVLEAMAMGVPVLMKVLEGLSDVFIPGFNVEVYKSNNELKEKLIYLKGNPQYCSTIGSNAAKTIEKDYTFNQIAGKIIDKLYGG
jgi:glycosyltransferase involved in cell wall biosynthesis